MSKQCEYTIITMFINELLFNIVIIIIIIIIMVIKISICRLGSMHALWVYKRCKNPMIDTDCHVFPAISD